MTATELTTSGRWLRPLLTGQSEHSTGHLVIRGTHSPQKVVQEQLEKRFCFYGDLSGSLLLLCSEVSQNQKSDGLGVSSSFLDLEIMS
jgi:hypothetical protein